MEYFEALPRIEGEEGEEGVPGDLYSGGGDDVKEGTVLTDSDGSAILVADWKRRWRRMSSSICFCWRWRRRKGSALALFQRENRISVGVEERRCGVKTFGEKRGKGTVGLSAIAL